MATLTEAQAAASTRLTQAFKARENKEAAKVAAQIALYYQIRVDPASVSSVERWLAIAIPRLILASDSSAQRATAFFAALRRIELGRDAPAYRAEAKLGLIDEGVRKSLLVVGPYSYENKMREIEKVSKATEAERKAMIREAKEVTTGKIAAASVRHAQAGGRQTIHTASAEDQVALGWVRVTRANPCYFCAALASRGLRYRSFSDGSFDESDLRFTGDGDAKVHDECGCSLKPVYATNDPLVDKTKVFDDMWSMWGAGGGAAMQRFRRGYEHFQKTGEYLTHEEAAAA